MKVKTPLVMLEFGKTLHLNTNKVFASFEKKNHTEDIRAVTVWKVAKLPRNHHYSWY